MSAFEVIALGIAVPLAVIAGTVGVLVIALLWKEWRR